MASSYKNIQMANNLTRKQGLYHLIRDRSVLFYNASLIPNAEVKRERLGDWILAYDYGHSTNAEKEIGSYD